jgi:hypothetical protein
MKLFLKKVLSAKSEAVNVYVTLGTGTTLVVGFFSNLRIFFNMENSNIIDRQRLENVPLGSGLTVADAIEVLTNS